MARSRLTVAVLATALGGCDIVAGLSGDAEPCDVASFDSVMPVDVVAAEDFSFDWDETFGVVMSGGSAFEVSPRDGALTPIDLGPYSNSGLALTPEGDALFYTAAIEPPLLQGALRGRPAEWKLAAGVPRGTYAGTPSADIYGPRRVLVRMGDGADVPIEEYEDKSGVWTPIGEHAIQTGRAPNLTPNGLTMVYPGVTVVDELTSVPGVFVADRASTDAPFGEPRMILAATTVAAQLVGRCHRLYISDGTMLKRYEQ